MRPTEEQESSVPRNLHRNPATFHSNRRSRTDDSDPLEEFESVIVVSNRQPYRHEYVGGDDSVEPADSSGPDDTHEPDASNGPDDQFDPRENDGTQLGTDGGKTDVEGNGVDVVDSSIESNLTHGDNRSISVDRPTGGLTAGLDPVLQRTGGTWIAWGDGDADPVVVDDSGCVEVPPEDPAYTLQRIWLDDDDVDAYYYGFSNRVLWPACHEFPELIDCRPGDIDGYCDVNRTFAESVAEHATEDSLVWIQDYHLGLAPAMIRKTVPSSTTIGQFWHIPWPTTDVFRHCPHGRELVEGVLGNDLLGFHVDRYVERFLDSVERYLPGASVDRDRATVHHQGTVTRVVSTPMGVDARHHDRESREMDGSRLENLRRTYDIPDGVALGVGVDRLDYSKGIPERLEAIEHFFERAPAWRGSFTFFQIATPSRTEITAYQELGECVRHQVERINDRFATSAWSPIVYTEDFLPREDLCALYRHADMMIVSSLLDGMNLVAQEYVASNVDESGALLLSEHVGSHDTLGDVAYTIDPYRSDQVAATIESALSTPPAVRRKRMRELRRRVFELDLEWWMDQQFGELARAGATETDRENHPRSISPDDA